MIYFLSIGMVFNVNAGFSGLVNESADSSEGKNYALFIGDTVVVNEVRCFGTLSTFFVISHSEYLSFKFYFFIEELGSRHKWGKINSLWILKMSARFLEFA